MKMTYYLKNNPQSSLVILQMKFSGRKLTYCTPYSIAKDQKKNWKKGRTGDRHQTRESGLYQINDSFYNLWSEAMNCFYHEQASGKIPNPSIIKAAPDNLPKRKGK